MIDSRRFPHTAGYLAGLPAGLDSHPECTALAEAYEGARLSMPATVPLEELPMPIAEFLRGIDPNRWIPDVVGVAAEMVMVDAVGEAAFMQWSFDDATRFFQRPVIRHLMRLVSPTLVVMGATSRWGAVHHGSVLRTEPIRKADDRVSTVGVLTFPSVGSPGTELEFAL